MSAEREAARRWPERTDTGLEYPADALADALARLDAVRALHQPLEALNVNAPPGRQRARVCAVCAGHRGPWAAWPCATIQAIEGDDR